jgi:hypothetical protein
MLSRNFGRQCVLFKSHDTIEVLNPLNELKTFTFDRVFDTESTQAEIFEKTAKPLIADVLQGYNATIFTYGQSGSGKTHTMYGEDILDEVAQGIIPRAITEIFSFINDEKNQEIKFELKFSMLEIYMENLYDLLNPEAKSSELKIKEHSKRGIYVENLSETYISSQEEFLFLIHEAEKYRSVSETSLNKNSSRSHLLFQLQITQKMQDDTERRGALNLIDLAGSEKVSKTHAIGITLEEAKKINLSLSNLGNVIYALASNSDYIPYRDSKLTRILQDSLGGNSKTMLIVNCSVHSYNAEETLSTLQFAKRAKKIKNKVKINIKRSSDQLEAIIEYLTEKLRIAQNEIKKLKVGIGNGSHIALASANLEFLKVDYKNNNKNFKDFIKQNNSDFSLYDNIDNFDDEFGSENRKNNFEILSEMKRKGSSQLVNTVSNNLGFGAHVYQQILEVNRSTERNNEINGNIIKSLSGKNLNFTTENFESETLFNKEKLELLNTIKNKDKEIQALKSELQILKNQNSKLEEKVQLIVKDNLIENLIIQTENSMREFIKELSNTYNNLKDNELKQLKENLVEMKSYQIEAENKYLEVIKDITEFKEADFPGKLNFLNPKINNYLNNQHATNLGSNKNGNLNISKKYYSNNPNNNLNNNPINFGSRGEKNIFKVNSITDNNNLNFNEKEVTLFDNIDDDLNISINTCNKIGLKNTSSRQTIKLTIKRNEEDKDNLTNTNNNLFNDSISNISTFNQNLIRIPRDRSTNKDSRNLKYKADKIICNVSNVKGKNEKLFNTNFVKKSNTINFNYDESANQFHNIKKDNDDDNNKNIKVRENLSNLSPKTSINPDITLNKNHPYNTDDNLFNTIQYNSNEKVPNKFIINNIINNINGNEADKKTKILLNVYHFNQSCEELFNKIEGKMKNNLTNISQVNEKYEKTNDFKSDNKNIINNHKKENIFRENGKSNLESQEPKTRNENNPFSMSNKALNTPLDHNKIDESGNLNYKNKNKNPYNYLILSYKKIFENNSFYSAKILDQFLKNLDHDTIQQSKIEQKNENSVLYNIRNNHTDENKSTIRTDRRSEFNLGNNINLLSNTTVQDDFFSVNDKFDGKDQTKIFHFLENHQPKKDLDFTLNKNVNLAIDHFNNEDQNFGAGSKMVRKLKNGFVSLMLKNIYYEKLSLELLTRLSLDLSKIYF